MKIGYGIVALAGLALVGCGKSGIDFKVSRITVKHATDPEAKQISLTPQPATVEDLVSTRIPDDIESHQTTRVGPFEKTVWQVPATIKSIQLKPDGDYYLKIEGKTGAQSVVEVPDPKKCEGSPLQAQIESTRKELEQRYHPTKKEKPVDDKAQVEGVGFLGLRTNSKGGGRLMPGTGITFDDSKGKKP